MGWFGDRIQVVTKNGEPATIGGFKVTPRSQALILRLPNGGLGYNRPVSVRVQRGDQVQILPIVDVTRTAVLVLVTLALVFTLVSLGKGKQVSKGSE